MKPFVMIDAALTEACVAREDIECIAVGLGPGSHAGIRIAIAIAQGWQIARGIKLLGIASAEAVAAQAAKSGRTEVFVSLDGGRGELFVAHYKMSCPEKPKPLEPFRLLAVGESLKSCQSENVVRMDQPAGQETTFGVGCPPDARMLAKLAAAQTDFLAAAALEPIYLRRTEFVKAPPARFCAELGGLACSQVPPARADK